MFEPYVKENYYWIYNRTNPWHRQIEYYKDDPRSKEDISTKPEELINDKHLEMMVVGRIYQARVLADFCFRTIKLAEEIITEIEADIEKE